MEIQIILEKPKYRSLPSDLPFFYKLEIFLDQIHVSNADKMTHMTEKKSISTQLLPNMARTQAKNTYMDLPFD